jgi:cytochrome P450
MIGSASVRSVGVAVTEYHPYADVVKEDPYPTYRDLRETCPVYHNEERDFWALFRFEDVRDASRDWQTFTSTSGAFLENELEAMREFMPPAGKFQDMDPPRSAELRRLVRDPFAPSAVQKQEPEIRALVTELIDRFADRGEADFATEFAEPLPVTVISDMLGIPRTDQGSVSHWCHVMFERTIEGRATDAAYEAGYGIKEYFRSMMEERRRRPRADLMSHIANASIGDVPLTDDEVVGMTIFLYAAGNETTSMLIGNALWLLDRYPEKRAELVAAPEKIPTALEEMLRFEAPVSNQARMTKRDTELRGCVIPKGKKVLLVYGSANRDETAFPRADELDLDRPPARHVSFGEGIHFCLGAPLARLEARVALEELLRRIPEYRVTGPVQWSPASVLRGPVSLPVEFR